MLKLACHELQDASCPDLEEKCFEESFEERFVVFRFFIIAKQVVFR